MNYCLIIIDMQYSFIASRDAKTILACKEEIKSAIKKGWYIFFIEYKGNGKTLKKLTNLTKDYDKVFVIKKNVDDGSSHIMKEVFNLGIVNAKFRVCGVNTSACIEHTVIGLSKWGRCGYKVEVISKAINDECYDHWTESAIKSFKRSKNINYI